MTSTTSSALTIIVAGPPKSGKDEQAEAIARALVGQARSSGKELRLRLQDSSASGAVMNSGGLVPEEVFQKIFTDMVQTVPLSQTLTLSGVAKKPSEAPWVIEELRRLGRSLNLVISLEIDRAVFDARCHTSRSRPDDAPEFQDERWARFEQETSQSIRYFDILGLVVKVDGRPTIPEVTTAILAELKKLGFYNRALAG